MFKIKVKFTFYSLIYSLSPKYKPFTLTSYLCLKGQQFAADVSQFITHSAVTGYNRSVQ